MWLPFNTGGAGNVFLSSVILTTVTTSDHIYWFIFYTSLKMRPLLLWDVMECRLVVCNSCSGTAY